MLFSHVTLRRGDAFVERKIPQWPCRERDGARLISPSLWGLRGKKATEFSIPAQRPANSRQDCSSWEQELGFVLPVWREDLRHWILS